MRWNQYRLRTTTAAEELVIAALYEAGVAGVEIEDALPLSEADKQQMFVDIPPEMPVDDGVAHLSFYLDPADPETKGILDRVQEALDGLSAHMDIGEAKMQVREMDDAEWKDNWKQFFRAFRVDDIQIIPSWEEQAADPDARIVLRIDPGSAFGTGRHETTQLCIRAIRDYLKPGDALLDLGCGSGILAITALKLGAAFARGVDLDPNVRICALDNRRENGIGEEEMPLDIGDITSDAALVETIGHGRYDLVVANILAEVLCSLTEHVVPMLKTGGIYITSGILAEKEQMVIDACKEAGLTYLETRRQGEWVSVIARRP